MAPPILRSPSNGASGVDSKKSKFVWNQVPGATQYLISVYGISPVKLLYQNFTDSTWVYVSDLPANLNCQWVVLAMGNKISKKYSATWKFTTNAMVSVDQDLKEQMGHSYSLYPNPTDGILHVHRLNSVMNESIFMYDELGKCIYTSGGLSSQMGNQIQSGPNAAGVNKTENGSDVTIDVSGLNPGLYWLKIGSETSRFMVIR